MTFAGHELSTMIIPPLAVAMVVALLLVAGCHDEPGESEGGGERTVPAAAADDYLNGQPTSVKRVIATPAIPPAPKPTAALPKGTSCVTAECHAKFTNASQIHRPIAEKACDSCHGDDIGGHKYPLKRGKTDTCTFCHAVAGTATHQHAPLKDGQVGCASCHDPHVSQTKFLLKADNVEQLCVSCHKDKPQLQKFAHEPFAKGQCTLCHEPHQSANAKLLRGGAGNEHCFTCHTSMKTTFKHARSVHKPAQEACVTCHNPHSSEFAHELNKPVQETCLTSGCHDDVKQHMGAAPVKHAAMTNGKSCSSCHNPHASPQQDHLLTDRADNLCITCHTEMRQTLATAQFLHGAVRVGNCSACHDPHGGKFAGLLDRAFPQTFYTRFDVKKYDLCFTCHEANVVLTSKTTTLTNFRNGDVNLHFVHVNRDEKGRSCKTCHELHGSNLPNHMASSVPFEGSKWVMPIAYEKSDSGGSCTPGCHTTKRYDRGGAATVIPTKDQPTTRGAS
jgi:predicted CXXCH cytochrome family protein